MTEGGKAKGKDAGSSITNVEDDRRGVGDDGRGKKQIPEKQFLREAQDKRFARNDNE